MSEINIASYLSNFLLASIIKSKNKGVMSERIFEEELKQDQGVHTYVHYSDDVNSRDYVSQFLNISDIDDHVNIVHMSIEAEDLQSYQDEEFEQYEEPVYHKSCFHNFQKHLITSLRNIINPEQIPNNTETHGLERKLWDFFVASNKNTRTLLYLVSGEIDVESKKNKKIAKKYGMTKIIKNSSMGMIRESQTNLRNQLLRQFEGMDLDQKLKDRRIKDKENFKIYLLEFIEELKSGGLKKRVSKKSMENISKTLKQRDFQGLSFNKV